MNNEWITDRLPTAEDADCHGYVWVTDKDGKVWHTMWDCVTEEPWMHFTRPAPYVKPKRFVATEIYKCQRWLVIDSYSGKEVSYSIPTREAAEEIASIYEREMP